MFFWFLKPNPDCQQMFRIIIGEQLGEQCCRRGVASAWRRRRVDQKLNLECNGSIVLMLKNKKKIVDLLKQ